MDSTAQSGKNRWQRYLLASLFLLLLLYSTDALLSLILSPEKMHSRFSKEVIRLEEDFQVASGILRNPKIIGKDTGTFFMVCDQIRKKAGEDISVFLLLGDSVVQWNSSREILPANLINDTDSLFRIRFLSGGWFAISRYSAGGLDWLLVSLVRNQYSIRNEYLRNSFSSRFSLPEAVSMTMTKTDFPVYASDHRYLFSLSFEKFTGRNFDGRISLPVPLKPIHDGWLLLLFSGSFLFLSLFVRELYRRLAATGVPVRLIPFFFFLDILLLRGIQFWFRFPQPLYQTGFFGPGSFSSSALLPSPGDLLINALVFLFLALFIENYYRKQRNEGLSGFERLRAVAVILILVSLFAGYNHLVRNLILNSSFSLDFRNIAEMKPESALGLVIILLLTGALSIFAITLNRSIHRIAVKGIWIPAAVLIGAAIGGTLLFPEGTRMYFLPAGAAGIYLILARFSMPDGTFRYRNGIFALLFFYSLLATMIINEANSVRRREKVSLMGMNLLQKHNPLTEARFEEIAGILRRDTVLSRLILSESEGKLNAGLTETYLKENYFNDYWRKYNMQVTLCREGQQLRIQPQGYLVGCLNFFDDLVKRYGEPTAVPELFYLDYGYGKEYYIAKFTWAAPVLQSAGGHAVYIELSSNGFNPDPGYPGLLIDQSQRLSPDMASFSYAMYRNGSLVQSAGDLVYPMIAGKIPGSDPQGFTFHDKGIRHTVFQTREGTILMISTPERGILNFITPFSYFLTLFALIILIVAGFRLLIRGKNSGTVDLRIKLQMSLTGLLLFTMLIIGIVQVVYIITINKQKNQDNLQEKAYSVRTEVQHKFSQVHNARELQEQDPETFLIKLANVFFTDINFYDPGGALIASSRYKIFEEGMHSTRMDPEAFRRMVTERNNMLIQEERIGNMKFSSAYLPMYNEEGNILGYINLPYFAKQDELKKQISVFLVTFMNIYIVLILLGAVISIIISNYITSPLSMLSEKLSKIKLGNSNEKIIWKNHDEIGRLVEDYNRMIGELEKSAIQLAQTERTSAWREMARQVAHEIKNPLTPMKLSAQHLLRAWKDQAPDMGRRIERFTSTLVEQIDALSSIASDFSDFARMPLPVREPVDMTAMVENILAWYPSGGKILFRFDHGSGNHMVLADQSRMRRMLTNLINNAVQAIGEKSEGLIHISLARISDIIELKITDNGIGIPDNQKDRIFQPNFTTKSAGMGLGLAIVKGIVTESAGTIEVESAPDEGTTFTISFPAIREISSDHTGHQLIPEQ